MIVEALWFHDLCFSICTSIGTITFLDAWLLHQHLAHSSFSSSVSLALSFSFFSCSILKKLPACYDHESRYDLDTVIPERYNMYFVDVVFKTRAFQRFTVAYTWDLAIFTVLPKCLTVCQQQQYSYQFDVLGCWCYIFCVYTLSIAPVTLAVFITCTIYFVLGA